MLFFSPIHVLFSASFGGGEVGLFSSWGRIGGGRNRSSNLIPLWCDLSDFGSVLLHRVRRGGRGFKL
jgi:hypothetical protein